MTDHLLKLGHRRIAFISGDPDHLAIMERGHGVQDSLKECNDPDCELIIRQGFNTFESGQKAARYLLTLKPAPTAIFAANDDMAAGVIFQAQEMGLRIPEDISVAGFDNTLLSARIWPGLTTISQPTSELGAAAARALIKNVRGEDIIQEVEIPTKLIIRGTRSPPRTS